MFLCLITGLVIVPTIILALFIGKTKDITQGGRFMYIMTLFMELPCIMMRFILAGIFGIPLLMPVWILGAIFFGIMFLIKRSFWIPAIALPLAGFVLLAFALACAFGPVIWSFLSLIGMKGGHRLTRFTMGARRMSRREKIAYGAALTHIDGIASIQAPSHVFVTRWPDLRMMVIGTTLYIAKPLLHGEGTKHLAAVLAHNLGYVNSSDGRLVLALRRLVVPPLYLLSWAIGETAPGTMLMRKITGSTIPAWILWGALALAGGGWGCFILSPFWAKYWSDGQYVHDAFAALHGQRHQLIAYLEKQASYDVAVPYFFPPYADTELRIDALMNRGTQPLQGGLNGLNPISAGARPTAHG
jgi:hypothetical protein